MMITSRFYYSLAELVGEEDYYIINYHDPYYTPGELVLGWGVEETVSQIMSGAGDMFESSDNISKELMAHIWANISHKYIMCFDVVHPVWQQITKDDVDSVELIKEKKLVAQSI